MPTPQPMPDVPVTEHAASSIASAESEPPTAYVQPKLGTQCGQCDDWGTVVVPVRGIGREVICPVDECDAAKRARRARESR